MPFTPGAATPAVSNHASYCCVSGSRPESAGTFSIRRLQATDLSIVAGFESDIARLSFPENPITDPRFHQQRLQKLIDDPKAGCFVAEAANGVVGWALVTERENFGTKERYGDFRSLYVAESHRRSAVAAALMRAVVDFCIASKLATLVGRTGFNNDAMRSVYEAYKFKPKHIVYELQVISPESAQSQ